MALVLSDTTLLAHLDSVAAYNNNADAWGRNQQHLYRAGTHVADDDDDGRLINRRANVCVVQRQLFARSERVKGIDFHPTEPWILTTLYSGHVYIWSYETQVCAL